MSSEGKTSHNPYVGIAAVVGGITVAMIAMILFHALSPYVTRLARTTLHLAAKNSLMR